MPATMIEEADDMAGRTMIALTSRLSTIVATALCMLVMSLLAGPASAQLPVGPPDRQLAGQLVNADSATYQVHGFDVPPDVHRLVVAIAHDGNPAASLIELGLADPYGFRGASSKKTSFTISEIDATPGYLAGRLPVGDWKVTFSIGQLPEDKPTNWTLKVWFLSVGEILPANVKSRGRGWYRGDMHMHSGHSDGFCASQSGAKVPCPLYNAIASAGARGLDFVMLTEHNTVSQAQVIRELQPAFDRVLLIPAQEVTTFYGHINVWGVDKSIDYRIVPGGRSFNELADEVHRLGGLVSINHPKAPTGAMCLGCGWSMRDVDYSKVDAVEAVNGAITGATGGDPQGPLSGIPFWIQHQKNANQIVAVGGSDTHDGTAEIGSASTIGRPTTVVFAEGLDQAAIIKGLKSGRVFVDIAYDPAAVLDLQVSSGARKALMGGSLEAGKTAVARVDVKAPPGSRLELMDGDTLLATRTLTDEDAGGSHHEFQLKLSVGLHVVRAQVRGTDNRLRLLSNSVLAKRVQ